MPDFKRFTELLFADQSLDELCAQPAVTNYSSKMVSGRD